LYEIAGHPLGLTKQEVYLVRYDLCKFYYPDIASNDISHNTRKGKQMSFSLYPVILTVHMINVKTKFSNRCGWLNDAILHRLYSDSLANISLGIHEFLKLVK
jgi:hypothetical protein